MPKQTAKKKITRRKKAEPLVLSALSKPVPQARVISVTTNATPPLSPYVIRLEVGQPAPSSEATPIETIAPTMAEELALEKQSLIDTTAFSLPRVSFSFKPLFEKTSKIVMSPVQWLASKSHSLPHLVPVARTQVLLTKKTSHKSKRKKSQPFAFNFNFNTLLPSTAAFRAAVGFAIVALLFVLPASGISAFTKLERTKNELTAKSRTALGSFKLASNNLDDVPQALNNAQANLLETKLALQSAVGSFDAILPFIPRAGTAYRDGKMLLDAGNHLTEAGKIITSGLTSADNDTLPPTTRLMHIDEALRSAYPLIDAATIELNSVSIAALPENTRESVSTLRDTVRSVQISSLLAIDLLPLLEQFLGIDHTQRYLVIFQNPNELRATGGFIGSFALVDLDRGDMHIIDIPGGGSYDMNCCLNEHVISPDPLHLIEPHWQFRDANWFPDFPTSAQKIAWFYEKSGGPSVDGVISINASLVPELLKLTGPITIPEFEREFTAENFISETQKIVELEYDRTENKPKKLIGLLAPELLSRLRALPREQWLPTLEVLQSALEKKDIQIYSTDSEIEAAFEQVGWTGELHHTDGDYLMVVAANIAGGKTSGVIETNIRHHATIALDGSITDQLDITRTHHGAKGELFTGVHNVEYIRTYVPEGSELIAADGFEMPPQELFQKPDADYLPDPDLLRIMSESDTDALTGTSMYNESGKTVFGNWMQVDPGETVTAHLTYRLPFKVTFASENSLPPTLGSLLNLPTFAPYSLLIEKQSGFTPSLDSQIQYPSGYAVRWKSPSLAEPEQLHFSGTLTTTTFLSVLFEH